MVRQQSNEPPAGTHTTERTKHLAKIMLSYRDSNAYRRVGSIAHLHAEPWSFFQHTDYGRHYTVHNNTLHRNIMGTRNQKRHVKRLWRPEKY